VRQANFEGYHKGGAASFDVANDGRIAIIDPVNERIIIFKPDEGSYLSYPLPFTTGSGRTWLREVAE